MSILTTPGKLYQGPFTAYTGTSGTLLSDAFNSPLIAETASNVEVLKRQSQPTPWGARIVGFNALLEFQVLNRTDTLMRLAMNMWAADGILSSVAKRSVVMGNVLPTTELPSLLFRPDAQGGTVPNAYIYIPSALCVSMLGRASSKSLPNTAEATLSVIAIGNYYEGNPTNFPGLS